MKDFDVVVIGAGNAGLAAAVSAQRGDFEFEVVQERDLYRITMPGEFDVTLPASWTGLRKKLLETYPAESENIPTFLALCGYATKRYPLSRYGYDDLFIRSLQTLPY